MKTRHTESNWKVISENGGNDIYVKDFHERGALCKVYVDNSVVSGQQGLANAKLMATSPELLKALVDIKILYMNSPLNEYFDPYKEAWANVENVIKKATI